jgi:hypothetical protein
VTDSIYICPGCEEIVDADGHPCPELKAQERRAKHAAYMRARRHAAGARPGANGPPVRTLCPDPTAYVRHIRNKETPDDACKEAWAIYRRIGPAAYRADEKTIRAGLMAKYGLSR